MTKPRSVLSAYLRLLWNHVQLLTLLATFRFEWPTAVKRFLNLFETVSEAPQEIFSFECLLMETSALPRFFTNLLFNSLTPVAVTLVIALVWRIRMLHRGGKFCSRFISSILIFYFLIHPTVARYIFQLFK